MSIINFFDHPGKKANREYFIHLIQIALADNTISGNESEMLHRIGWKLGFTNPEIENMIASTHKSDWIPPYELLKRFEQVYEIVKMIMADGVIENNEMRLATSFSIKSGFSENEIPLLISLLVKGIREGKDEEVLFEDYKKEKLSFNLKNS